MSHVGEQLIEVARTLLGWLTQYRSEQMAVRLAAGRATVSEIGRSVGWPDPSYAARRFRATYGVSPTEYRRRFAFSGERGDAEDSAEDSMVILTAPARAPV